MSAVLVPIRSPLNVLVRWARPSSAPGLASYVSPCQLSMTKLLSACGISPAGTPESWLLSSMQPPTESTRPTRQHAIERATFLADIEKCQVVCANCHRARTHLRRQRFEAPSSDALQRLGP